VLLNYLKLHSLKQIVTDINTLNYLKLQLLKQMVTDINTSKLYDIAVTWPNWYFVCTTQQLHDSCGKTLKCLHNVSPNRLIVKLATNKLNFNQSTHCRIQIRSWGRSMLRSLSHVQNGELADMFGVDFQTRAKLVAKNLNSINIDT